MAFILGCMLSFTSCGNADYCHIMTPKMNAVLDAFCVWYDASNWSVFNEASGTGILRHLTIRYAHQTGQLMVILNNFSTTICRWLNI